ncbi:MAG: hypothetical protein O2948_07845 [Proteobacteria bacterium]|jgi:hypothetical protein|nr:hypothetical protein [Pseudomonadota bacterium]MDA0926753.1 hypothetical protein [Pseudomonadota bacterium]
MRRSTYIKLVVIPLLIYVAIVLLFESSLGFFQPQAGNTVVISTFDDAGVEHQRVVSLLESDGKLYVAVNHWPRAWYRRVLNNPGMRMNREGISNEYRGVVVVDPEYRRVQQDNPVPLAFRFLTGFPPRHFVRLDPQ